MPPLDNTLRRIPRIDGPRPEPATGVLSEEEIFALGNGDVAAFPGYASGDERPRAFVASPYMPFPLSHGGAVRIFNLMRQGARTHALVPHLLSATNWLRLRQNCWSCAPR